MKDSCGWTPLHIAGAEGQKTVAEWLLSLKADILAVDEDGKTAADWAKTRGQIALHSFLEHAQKATSAAS